MLWKISSLLSSYTIEGCSLFFLPDLCRIFAAYHLASRFYFECLWDFDTLSKICAFNFSHFYTNARSFFQSFGFYKWTWTQDDVSFDGEIFSLVGSNFAEWIVSNESDHLTLNYVLFVNIGRLRLVTPFILKTFFFFIRSSVFPFSSFGILDFPYLGVKKLGSSDSKVGIIFGNLTWEP